MILKPLIVVATSGWMLLGSWCIRSVTGPEKIILVDEEMPGCGVKMPADDHAAPAYQPKNGINGKTLFQANCASCHNPLKDATGPALKGAFNRAPGRQWIYDWVHNSSKMIADGDAYANALHKAWGGVQMTAFPNLSNEQIDAIMEYVEH